MSAASGCTGRVSPTPASTALEVVLADRPAEIGPFAAFAPIVGQPRFAHQLLEPRIGTRRNERATTAPTRYRSRPGTCGGSCGARSTRGPGLPAYPQTWD